MNTPTPAPWILTHAGTEHALTDVQHLLTAQRAPRIETIAHSLAQINRFTGHTARPYSVAEHSVLVCRIVEGMGLGADAQLLALMHDAHECIVGDVATPIKQALGKSWLELENAQAFALRVAYGLSDAHQQHAAAVKAADLIALATERRDLLNFDPEQNLPWPVLDTPGAQVQPLPPHHTRLDSLTLCALSWRHHRAAFLHRHAELTAALQQTPQTKQTSIPQQATAPAATA